MFRKNSFRPALAGVSVSDKHINNKQKDCAMFNNAEANDFNSFSSSPSKNSHKRQKPPKKDMTLEINPRSLIIAVASILAAILMIVLIATVVSSANKSIKFEDNTFVCYQDVDGNYRIARNGRLIDEVFLDPTEMTAASDNSFAYITVNTAEGYDVYILDGNKPELVCQSVEKVLAYAEFEPAVVYVQKGRTAYYYDESDTVLTNSDETASNIAIAPDGSALIYNCPNRNDASISSLYLYTTENSSPEQLSSGKDSMIPVSVSNNGKYVLAYVVNAENNNAKELYAILDGESYKIEGVDGSFEQITYANSTATELVFSTTAASDGKDHTYVYNCKDTGARKDNTAHHLSTGVSVPKVVDTSIVRLDTVKKSYFENTDEKSTFYVNNKYATNMISSFLGEFDPDLEYFYFVNEQKKVLCKMEIRNGKGASATSIAYDVVDFEVTEKGNVYYLDEYLDFYFYKLSKDKSHRLASDVSKIELYEYSNTLQVEKYNSDDTVNTYTSSEGSELKVLKLAKVEMTVIPTLTNSYSKKTYAYYEDAESGNYILFYTSNGRTFKQIASCIDISFG